MLKMLTGLAPLLKEQQVGVGAKEALGGLWGGAGWLGWANQRVGDFHESGTVETVCNLKTGANTNHKRPNNYRSFFNYAKAN
jgi:hypothetical protein